METMQSPLSQETALPTESNSSQRKQLRLKGKGGIMPLPSSLKLDLTKMTMPSRSILSASKSPRLSRWIFNESAATAMSCRISIRDEVPNQSYVGKVNPETSRSRAARLVDSMLSSKTSLEDFVMMVESSSGVERWAYWMEISTRLQIAQQVSHRDFESALLDQQISRQNFSVGGDLSARRQSDGQNLGPSSSLQRDRMLAQSIMRRAALNTKATQTQRWEFAVDDDIHQNSYRRAVSTPRSRNAERNASGRSVSGMSGVRRTKSQKETGLAAPIDLTLPAAPGLDENAIENETRAAAMQLLFQTIGVGRSKLSDTIVQRIASVVEVDLCRILFIDVAGGTSELVEQTEEKGKIQERVDANAGILGDTYRRKTFVSIPNVSDCNFFRPSDLGESVCDIQEWTNGRIVSCPVPLSSGDITAIILFGRTNIDFTAVEVEFIAWFAVILGQIIENSDDKEKVEGQIAVAESIASKQIELWKSGTVGCDVLDPVFWMSSFRSETAQVIIVYEHEEDKPLLYCTSSDVSKHGISMTCFPLRGICKKMVLRADGEPLNFSNVDREGDLDREVDLCGSEFEGSTSLLLVPVMNIFPTALGPKEKVVAVISVSSTAIAYGDVHLKMMQVLSLHLKGEILKILQMWRDDQEESFSLSFMQSPDLRFQIDQVSEEPSEIINIDIIKQDEVDKDSNYDGGPIVPCASTSAVHERSINEPEVEMLYDYSRKSIEKMIENEVGAGRKDTRLRPAGKRPIQQQKLKQIQDSSSQRSTSQTSSIND